MGLIFQKAPFGVFLDVGLPFTALLRIVGKEGLMKRSVTLHESKFDRPFVCLRLCFHERGLEGGHNP